MKDVNNYNILFFNLIFLSFYKVFSMLDLVVSDYMDSDIFLVEIYVCVY